MSRRCIRRSPKTLRSDSGAGSGFVFNQDFFAGYSPERINPGDHAHRLSAITKVTPGSTRGMLVTGGVLYDLKQVLPIGTSDARL